MVKVNLEYNPYLMDFKAKFNGKEPRINSLVEKYENMPLQTWINELPHILYDEMNGYDFDMEFIGPDLEYEDIEKSFVNQGISSDDVRCNHIKTMEGRAEKITEIIALNQWLEENRNNRLDLDSFKIENQDVFDNSRSIIIIGNTGLGDFTFDNINVSIEVITNINELENTELKDTPIVIDAESISLQDLQSVIHSILEMDSDVSVEQFFIFIHSKNKVEMYSRLLADIGFKNPKIINSIDDFSLRKYFEYYPVSDYIREYLSVIREKVDSIKSEMEAEKEESDKANGEVMSQIMMIEDHISSIKDAIVELNDINKTSVTAEWNYTKTKMLETITTWKIKKTKITSYDEAVKLAEQFEEEIKYQWDKFIDVIKGATAQNKDRIMNQCTDIYDKATRSKSPKYPNNLSFETYKSEFDGIKNEFLGIKEEHYEKPKEGLINSFLKEFNSASENKGDVLVTTYPCQKWREYAVEITTPIIDKIIEERNSELQEYCTNVTLDYLGKLIKLLDERNEDKEKFSERLSSDIRVLQKDFDWLNALIEKLETIERS